MEYDVESLGLDLSEADKLMLEDFAHKHLSGALRVVATKLLLPKDMNMIYDAMCLVTAMYMKKVQNGEIEINRVLH